MTYIYRITNNINGKTYIGQRKVHNNIDPLIDKYMGSGIHLKNAQKKYGINNFNKEIILISNEKQSIIDAQEKYYIFKERKLKGKENVYNIADGGGGTQGIHFSHTEATKKMLSNKMKGNKIWLGKHHTEATKKKMSKNHYDCGGTKNPAWKGEVLCIETNKIYKSAATAEKELCIYHVGNACNGFQKTAGGFHWKRIQKKIEK